MQNNTTKVIIGIVVVLVVALGIWFLAGRQPVEEAAIQEQEQAAAPAAPREVTPPVEEVDYTITILTVSHTGEIIAPDHPAILQIEEHTGYNTEWEFVLGANFAEQMNMRFAAGNLPGIVALTGISGPIVSAALGGAFWDLTDHIPQWPNLADANPTIMNNISIQGRSFGVYRQRPIGRNGIVIRTDWLDYLGIDKPETLDEFYEMLYAFTVNNPQPNGGDTYGMTWTGGFMGAFHQLAVMHGAPNRWEILNEKFAPWFEHEAFAEAMDRARWMFDNGIINPDFAALPTGDLRVDLYAGRVGVEIGVSDEARRTANALRDAGFMTQEELDAGEMVWVMGPVANAQGERRSMALSGHAGFVAISTSGAPTEESLQHHLNFMNMINDPIGQNIVSWGARDHNWEYAGNGTVRRIEQPTNLLEGLNQIMMRQNFVYTQADANSRENAIIEVQRANLDIAIHDPSLPFAALSDTWTANQVSLNQIIDDAVINYTMGHIDMDGFRQEVERWYTEGGQNAIDELSAALAAAR